MPEPACQKTILIVDDDAHFGGILGKQLKESGIRAALFPNADQAYRFLEDMDPAALESGVRAIVCDQLMPGRSGVDLLRQVRGGKFQHLPFILMTGTTNTAELINVIQLRPDGILLKPFSIQKLIDKVEAAVKARSVEAR